jgi:serine/threonine protein kinase
LELEKLGKFAKTKIPVKAYCSECRADVGKYAASDGKGLLLSDVARYLCKDCFTRKSSASPATQIGQYHLLQQLGQGGMGSVFLAWDAATCRLGALKRILLPEPDTKVARRFIREMKIMAEFSHPHLVRIYEDGVHEGAPYFFSEFLDGGSLTRYMKRNGGKLSSREALQITCDILSGLEFFHNSGHIHRDIKPSNILLNSTEEGMIPTAKIADFGLAKSFVGFGGTKLTKANEFAGSLYYTPPEQIINFSRVGPTADIYSAGVTLYQILTGMLPYNFQSTSSANSMKDSLLVVLEEPIIPIRERSATIPATLAAIVEKAIAKKAEDRFATAVIFKAELQQYLETMP